VVAELGLAGVALAAIAALWWCARRISERGDAIIAEVRQLAVRDGEIVRLQLQLDRAQFETRTSADAAATDKATIQRLEEAYATLRASTRSSDGLAADDVAGRLLRRREAAARDAAASARGHLPAIPALSVPDDGAAELADSPDVMPGERPDV